MKFFKDVQSTVSPILIDLNSSPTTKYVRESVREELIVQGEGEERQEYTMYTYDEYQYETQEYCIMKTKEVDSLKQDMIDMKGIIVEVYNVMKIDIPQVLI